MPIHVNIYPTNILTSCFEPLEARSVSQPMISMTENKVRSKKRALDLEDGSPPRRGARFLHPNERNCGFIATHRPGRYSATRKDTIESTFLLTPLTRRTTPSTAARPAQETRTSETLVFRNVNADSIDPKKPSSFAQSSRRGTEFIMLSLLGPGRAKADNGTTLGEEIKDHYGYSYRSPLFFGQHASHGFASNVVVKKIPRGPSPGDPLTRDHRGKVGPRLDKEDSLKRLLRVADVVNNPFKPIMWQDSNFFYLEAPVAKADYFDVVQWMHHTQRFRDLVKPSDRPWVRMLVGYRFIHDSLQQLKKLHDSNFSHNNIKPTNILFDSDLNSHLAGFSQAKASVMPPRGGVWENKRFESVIGSYFDTKGDDLWALGKVLMQTLFGLKENPNGHPDQHKGKKITRYADPFKPIYTFPSPGHQSGFELTEEVPYLEENIKEARTLQSLWLRMHQSFLDWNHGKIESAKGAGRGAYKVPFPSVPPDLNPIEAAHAKRIHYVFERVANLDQEGQMLRLALMLFAGDVKKMRSTDSILRMLLQKYHTYFITDKDKMFVTDEELALPRFTFSDQFLQATDPLGTVERQRLLERLDNERLMRVALSEVRGNAMYVCNKTSTLHAMN